MSKITNMTDDQIRELQSKPYSDENVKQLSEIVRADSWLLVRNLNENEKQESEEE